MSIASTGARGARFPRATGLAGALQRLRAWLLEQPAGTTPAQRRLVATALRFGPTR